MLEHLYSELRRAQTERSAEAIAQAVEQLWFESGSATINLLLMRAVNAIHEGEYQRARELLDTVVTTAPHFAEGWNQRAIVHFLLKDYKAALADLRQVLALDPHHYKAIQGLAVILKEFGDKKRALAAFRRALEVYPLLSTAKEAVKELTREVEGQRL